VLFPFFRSIAFGGPHVPSVSVVVDEAEAEAEDYVVCCAMIFVVILLFFFSKVIIGYEHHSNI
jgi:hypothetical protein